MTFLGIDLHTNCFTCCYIEGESQDRRIDPGAEYSKRQANVDEPGCACRARRIPEEGPKWPDELVLC